MTKPNPTFLGYIVDEIPDSAIPFRIFCVTRDGYHAWLLAKKWFDKKLRDDYVPGVYVEVWEGDRMRERLVYSGSAEAQDHDR